MKRIVLLALLGVLTPQLAWAEPPPLVILPETRQVAVADGSTLTLRSGIDSAEHFRLSRLAGFLAPAGAICHSRTADALVIADSNGTVFVVRVSDGQLQLVHRFVLGSVASLACWPDNASVEAVLFNGVIIDLDLESMTRESYDLIRYPQGIDQQTLLGSDELSFFRKGTRVGAAHAPSGHVGELVDIKASAIAPHPGFDEARVIAATDRGLCEFDGAELGGCFHPQPHIDFLQTIGTDLLAMSFKAGTVTVFRWSRSRWHIVRGARSNGPPTWLIGGPFLWESENDGLEAALLMLGSPPPDGVRGVFLSMVDEPPALTDGTGYAVMDHGGILRAVEATLGNYVFSIVQTFDVGERDGRIESRVTKIHTNLSTSFTDIAYNMEGVASAFGQTGRLSETNVFLERYRYDALASLEAHVEGFRYVDPSSGAETVALGISGMPACPPIQGQAQRLGEGLGMGLSADSMLRARMMAFIDLMMTRRIQIQAEQTRDSSAFQDGLVQGSTFQLRALMTRETGLSGVCLTDVVAIDGPLPLWRVQLSERID